MLPVDLAQADAEVSPLRDQLFHRQYGFIQALRLTRQHFADHANGIGIEGGFCLDDGGKRGGVYRGSTLHSQGQEGTGGEHLNLHKVCGYIRKIEFLLITSP
ncbi:hypothetical protein ALQ26_200041 [Pseudomonas amygdali pv. lachrymans]|nr:hypothetical protein ALQ26_200041 [Pseudomonas amygdali pv. lachrymans]